MKRFILPCLCLLLFVSPAFAGEKDVIKALEKIKANTETGVTLSKYNELLADAQVEINILKKLSNTNPDFIRLSEECLKKYKAAWAYWKMGNDMGPTKRGPYDLGMQKSWKEAAELLEEIYATLK